MPNHPNRSSRHRPFQPGEFSPAFLDVLRSLRVIAAQPHSREDIAQAFQQMMTVWEMMPDFDPRNPARIGWEKSASAVLIALAAQASEFEDIKERLAQHARRIQLELVQRS